jgi:hypothetical protein
MNLIIIDILFFFLLNSTRLPQNIDNNKVQEMKAKYNPLLGDRRKNHSFEKIKQVVFINL